MKNKVVFDYKELIESFVHVINISYIIRKTVCFSDQLLSKRYYYSVDLVKCLTYVHILMGGGAVAISVQ